MQNSLKKESSDLLKVISIPIEKGLISLRGLSPNRLRFELEYGLERGSTDNSFLFSGNDHLDQSITTPILVHPPGSGRVISKYPKKHSACKQQSLSSYHWPC